MDYYQYWICADDVFEDDENAVAVAAGLAQLLPGEVIITAAEQSRGVDVQVDILNQPEPWVDDGWQDAVEVSIHTDCGVIQLSSLLGDPVRAPNLATQGPGWYRLRLCAAERDPVHGKRPRERHLVQIWPAPEQPAATLRLTSKVAAEWAAPPRPPREIDWETLAATLGVRLIVGWKQLRPPENPALLAPTEVTVRDVLHGSPAQVYKTFANPIVGGVAGGMRPGGGFETQPDFHCYVIDQLFDPERDTGRTEEQRWIGNLNLVGRVLDSQRFRRLVLQLGFAEDLYVEPDQRVPHPIPPGSSTVEFTFGKHPEGRETTVTHRGIPAWLAGDVSAFWAMVLQQNRPASNYAAPMPWSDYTLADTT